MYSKYIKYIEFSMCILYKKIYVYFFSFFNRTGFSLEKNISTGLWGTILTTLKNKETINIFWSTKFQILQKQRAEKDTEVSFEV